MKAIVTVKVNQSKTHNPENKKTGPCPWSEICTDSTGGHHSFVVIGPDMETIKEHVRGYRVTRIEVLKEWKTLTSTGAMRRRV